jgi:hypothetical protein
MAKKPTAAQIAEQIQRLVADHEAVSPLVPLPLSRLYHELQAQLGPVTLGEFHDALRDLHASSAIRLDAWTGAMYQLDEPECCLLLGREIIGYARR